MASRAEILAEINSRGAEKFQSDMQESAESVDRFEDSAGSAQQPAAGLGDRMSSLGGRAKEVGGTLTATVTTSLGLFGAGAVNAASDAEEMQSKMATVFGKSENDIRQWAKAQEEATGITELEFQEYATTLQDTFVPMGVAKDEAVGMSKQVSSLAVDLASFNNMSTTESMDRLQGGLIGNHENLLAFGSAINEARLGEQLKKQFGVAADEATNAQKIQARLALIMEDTTAAQGDATRTADSFANRLKAVKGQAQEAGASLGTAMLPALKSILAFILPLIQRFASLDQSMLRIVGIAGAVAAALGPVLYIMGSLMTTIGPLAGAFGTVAAAVGAPVATAGALVAGLNPIVPVIGAVIVAVGALAAAFAADFAGVRTETMKTVAALRGTFGPIISDIIGAWASMDGRIQSVAGNVSEALEGRLAPSVASVGTQIRSWLTRIAGWWTQHGAGIVSTIDQFSTHAQEAVIQMMAAISSAFAGSGESEASFGYFFMESLREMLAAAQVLAPQIPQPIQQALTQTTARIRQAVSGWLVPFRLTFVQIQDAVWAGIQGVKALLSGDTDFAAGWFRLALTQARIAVTGGWATLKRIFAQNAATLPRLAASIPDRIVGAFRTLPAKLPQPVQQALSQAAGEFDTHKQQVTTKVSALTGLIPQKYRTALSGVPSAAQTKLGEVAGKFDGHKQSVLQKVSTLRGQLSSKYQQAVSTVRQKTQTTLSQADGLWNKHKGTVLKAVNVLVGPIGRYGRQLGLLDKKNKLTRDGMVALGSSLLTLAGPVGIAAGLAAKLGLAWQKNLFGIQTTTNRAIQGVRSAIQTHLPPIRAFISGVLSGITQLWSVTGGRWVTTLVGTARKLTDTIRSEAAGWAQTFRNWGALVAGIFRGVFAALIQIAQPLLARLGTFWKQHGDDIMFIVGAVSTAVSEIFRTLFTVLRDAAVTGLRIVSQLFRAFSNTLRGIIEPTVAVIGALWAKFGDELVAVIEFAFDIIASVVGTAIDALATLIRASMAAIDGDWTKAWNLIAGLFERVLDGIINFAKTWGGRLLDYIGGLVNGVVDWFGDLHFRAVEKVKKLADDALRFVGELKDKFVGFVGDLHFEAVEKFKNLKDGAVDWVGKMVSGAVEEAGKLKEKLKKKISGAVDAAKKPFENLYNDIVGNSIVPDLVADVEAEVAGMDMASPLAAGLSSALDVAASGADDIGSALRPDAVGAGIPRPTGTSSAGRAGAAGRARAVEEHYHIDASQTIESGAFQGVGLDEVSALAETTFEDWMRKIERSIERGKLSSS